MDSSESYHSRGGFHQGKSTKVMMAIHRAGTFAEEAGELLKGRLGTILGGKGLTAVFAIDQITQSRMRRSEIAATIAAPL